MATTPPKTPFRCPVCGFVQLEPPHLVSTNCRSCGAHYEAAAEGVRSGGTTELPTFAGAKQDPGKEVACLKCGRTHRVSKKAQSTICPGCYAPIELIEVKVTGPSSRAVDTRGALRITDKGILSNSWIVCGTARVEGVFHGHLRCEGEARLALSKPCTGRVTAGSVLVEKKSTFTCALPMETDQLAVRGTMLADVICHGTIRILSGGRLEGRVRTKAMVVEKGGVFFGHCEIVPPKDTPAEVPPPSDQQEAAGPI